MGSENALVAQWIEHPPPKGRVTRSIRVEGAKYPSKAVQISSKNHLITYS